jgi:hypothetical protein
MIRVEDFSFCDLLLLKTYPNIASLYISLLLSAWLVHSLSHSIIQQNYIQHLPSIKPCARCENARWIRHLLMLLSPYQHELCLHFIGAHSPTLLPVTWFRIEILQVSLVLCRYWLKMPIFYSWMTISLKTLNQLKLKETDKLCIH